MKHFYKEIPGWSAFIPLYKQAVERAPQEGATFVEIGSWKGRSAAYMAVEIANSGKKIDFHVIDTFWGSKEHQDDPDVKAGRLLDVFLDNIAPVRPYIAVQQGSSVDVAHRLFKHASLDFVMIDGAHDYRSVRYDIQAWYPKIKPGGVLAGDDFRWRDVRNAVYDYFLPSDIHVTPCCGRNGDKCWKVIKP